MWISEKLAAGAASPSVELGLTTLGGVQSAVLTRSELRDLPVFAPSGYAWLPRAGETVLILHNGEDTPVIAGSEQGTAPQGMQAGEVFLFSHGGASLFLRNDGTLCLRGNVTVEGNLTVTGKVEEVGA